MVDLKLEKNECILLMTTEVWRYFDDNELAVDTLFLTNQHLISVYKKSKGIFSKKETVIDKIPLASISIINDVVQIKEVKDDDYGETLQILYSNGTKELFEFTESPKKEYQQWKNTIKKAVIENSRIIIENDEMSTPPLVSEGNKQSVPIMPVEKIVNEKKDMFVYCTSCGEENNIGAKFCQNCGIPLGFKNMPKKNVERKERHNYQSSYSERRQEFAGKILKCPNCGEILKSFVALCPSCGYELRGVKANSSLKELSVKLENIDLQPDICPKKFLSRELTEKEKQKITLIRSFPIPNTKEDLYEFLIMAASNIDTEHIEGWNSSEQSEGEKALSDAWKVKYEQAYHKANISFGNSKEFQELNKTYLTKIQKHERKKSMFNKGLIIFTALYVIACIMVACFIFKGNSVKQKAVDEENKRLEFILDDIQKYIEEGEYAKARSLNATLAFNISVNLSSATDAKKHWDEIRKELYDVIENAENQDIETTQEK